MSDLTTNPASVTFGGGEQWAPGIDCTNQLTSMGYNGAPTLPTVTFTDADSGAAITLSDNPSVSGNVVSQRIAASKVTAGHSYNLKLTYTPSGTTDILEAVLVVEVPAGT